MSSNSFDDIRRRHPEVAINLYAMTPRGPVTLEVITPDGLVCTFSRKTAQKAIDAAFPPKPDVDIFS